jgi:hypothetical protein
MVYLAHDYIFFETSVYKTGFLNIGISREGDLQRRLFKTEIGKLGILKTGYLKDWVLYTSTVFYRV